MMKKNKKLWLLLLIVISGVHAQVPEYEKDNFKVEFVEERPEILLTDVITGNTIGLRYPILGSANYDTQTSKVLWGNGDYKIESYIDENGNAEIELILEDKPPVNTFEFILTNYEDYDFYKQYPLNEEMQLEESVSSDESHQYNEKGEVILYRPENVVNSYAIYRNGEKYFHIYRIYAYDFLGNRIYGDMFYSKGSLYVTIDQTFLDTAIYPVRIDPTIGNTNIGSSTSTVGVNDAYAIQKTSLEDGTVTSIHAYANTTVSNNWKGAIWFKDNSTIAGVCDNSVGTGSPSWIISDCSTNFSIDFGVEYYIGIINDVPTFEFYYDTVLNSGIRDVNNDYDTPLPINNSPDSLDFFYSVYVNYTATNETEPEPEPEPEGEEETGIFFYDFTDEFNIWFFIVLFIATLSVMFFGLFIGNIIIFGLSDMLLLVMGFVLLRNGFNPILSLFVILGAIVMFFYPLNEE